MAGVRQLGIRRVLTEKLFALTLREVVIKDDTGMRLRRRRQKCWRYILQITCESEFDAKNLVRD